MSGPMDQSALTQEVANLKDGHGELRRDMRNLEGKVDSGFAMLVQKLDTKTTTQWQPISIGVSVLLAIGAALYYPVREALAKQEAMVEVMRRESEGRIVRLWDEHNKTARELSYLQGQLRPLLPAPAKD